MPWLTRLSGVLGRVPLLSRVVTSLAGGILRANAAGLAFTIVLELIKRYWKDIKAFFVGFADGFVGKLGDIGAAMERVKIAFEPVLDMISQAIDWLLGKPSEDPAVNSLANGYAMGDTFGRFLELVLEIIENVGYLAKAFLDMFADIGKDLATTCNWLEKAYNWVLKILQSWGLFKDSYNPDNNFGPGAQKFQGFDPEQIKKGSQEAQRQAHLQREAAVNQKSTVNNDYSKTAYTFNVTTNEFNRAQLEKYMRQADHERARKSFTGPTPAQAFT